MADAVPADSSTDRPIPRPIPLDPSMVSVPGAAELFVRVSGVPGATIQIDARPPSPSPVRLQIEPGPHALVVTAPGRIPYRESLYAMAGMPIGLDLGPADLLPVTGALVVQVDAPGAVVTVDGAPVAAPAFRAVVAPGTHALRVAAPGYGDASASVAVAVGEIKVVRVEMRRRRPVVLAAGGVIVALVIGGILLARRPSAPPRRDASPR